MPRSKEETKQNWRKVGCGSRIAVYCERHYYACKVVEEKDDSSKFKVRYEDASEEWVDLAKKKFRWQEVWEVDSDDEEDKEKEVSDKDEEEASKEDGDESVEEKEASTKSTKRKLSKDDTKDKSEDSDATPTMEDEKDDDTKVVTPPPAKKTKVDEDYEDDDAGSDNADDDYSEGETQKKKTKKKPAKTAPKKTSKSSSAKKNSSGATGAERILGAIASKNAFGEDKPKRDEIMAMVAITNKNSFGNTIRDMKNKKNWVDYDKTTIWLTDEGKDHVGPDALSVPATNDAMQEKIRNEMIDGNRPREIFDLMLDGKSYSVAEIAAALNVENSRGFANNVYKLSKVTEKDGKKYRLKDMVFPFGRPEA